MQITASELHLSSSHLSSKKTHRRVEVVAPGPAAAQGPPDGETGTPPAADKVALSSQGRRLAAVESGAGEPAAPAGMERLRLQILQQLIERLTGRKIAIVDLQAFLANREGGDQEPVAPPAPTWAMVVRASHTVVEDERLAVTMQGQVTTADGRTIGIDVTLRMRRTMVQSESFELRLGRAAEDPLVLSFDGTAVELADERFAFDLDLDGDPEWLPRLAAGHGFLVLDRNGNGQVDDGSELFGPVGGDGFAELAGHDADGNHWIDANDPVFSRLRIWTDAGTDGQRLLALGAAGVGALYLDPAAAPFTLTTAGGQEAARLAQASVFLREDGTAGVLSRVDFLV